MGKKTVNFSKQGISKLLNDKPVVYKILTDAGNNNYTGIAGRGNVQDRLQDHLGNIPGAKVQVPRRSRGNADRRSPGRATAPRDPTSTGVQRLRSAAPTRHRHLHHAL